MGTRHVHAVSVDQTDRLALGRNPQRHHRALAQPHHRQRRVAQSVSPRHRRGQDDLEAAGLPEPAAVNGIGHAPLEGVSMLPTLLDANAPDTHDVQYFEMFGNRGIYHQGWTAVTKHRTPWLDDAPPLEDDVWELYGPDDWSQTHNLSHENPEKLAELQRLWLVEAVKYNVLPLDDRAFERFNADIAGRPQLIAGNRQTIYPGMRLNENCMLNLKNKSHSVTVSLTVPETGAAGVVIAHGSNVGGWSLYAHDGQATTSSASSTTS